MRKIKILHTGDIHFDTPFTGMVPNESIKSKEELKQVFEKIINLAVEENVDIMLIAGDIFDNLSVNKSTLYFIKKSFESISNIKVFISPGNHDPFNDRSFYKIFEWPENVYIFKGEMEHVVLEELQTVVWGAAFNKNHINASMMKNVNRISNYNNIMVIHGEVTLSNSQNNYNPITEEDILESHMDYIALGHRHKFSGIKKIGDTYCSYSGSPQGRGFDELGDKGVLIIELENNYVQSKFIKTSIRNYYEKEINIEGCFGYNEVKNKILSKIDKDDRNRNLYRIVLKGEISEEFTIRESLLDEMLKEEFYFVKVVDKSELKINIKDMLEGYSIKNIFARKMYDKLKNSSTEEEKAEIMLAFKLGIQSLSSEEVKIHEN